MGKYFGTDGVRGVANLELTPELVFRLGRFGAYVLTKQNQNAKMVIGRDTRLSGEMLEAALIAGITSVGVDVVRLGVISTPGVAFLTKHLEADAGVMISASHNPFPDNGIKFFNANGQKLADHIEDQIEQLLNENEDTLQRPIADKIGRVVDDSKSYQHYLNHLKSTIDIDLCGIHVVVDGANGAAYQLAPQLLRELGADVTTIHSTPDGKNINVECGSTHPESLQQEVIAKGAHIGLAFDGDADRLIAVDEQGELLDGDKILFICGQYLKEHGQLNQDTIVTTVMSNIGFFKAAENAGLLTEKTKVGDRYVLERMLSGGYNLGGEQSGHIIFLNYNTTGDGLLSAIQLLQVMKETGARLSDLSARVTTYPQLLKNVEVKSKEGWEQNEAIQTAIHEVEGQLKENGRVLVRPSGTEPLIRVMAEGPDQEVVKQYVQKIADVIQREMGK
ncbi:phosphoglucosamine mutase [Shimazuella sp. AN120528]|uniref:phosphoglucosamine mutase n=1 Tax=Shimazuella soli TaxID=1892854 RepID=UPI001F11024F|nr:phosphoglucosamine mutase [Shimazuella soli]MCH5585372.1 phosphoglucosamine mutase [Shimazuella soli]